MKKTQKRVDDAEFQAVCRFPLTHEEKTTQDKLARPTSMSDITWRIFRIMSEFVEGFQFLSTFSREVTVFGSARLPQENHWCQEITRLTHMLGTAGFTIVTGGGPGIMEAANKGAYEAGAPSLGINIQLPFEQRTNPYVTNSRGFHYFFTRKVMLTASGQAYVYGPGGMGTMDEFFEILTLVQTKKMAGVPIVCLGKEYWQPLFNWMEEVMYGQFEAINKEDLDLVHIVDTAEEAFKLIECSQERSFF